MEVIEEEYKALLLQAEKLQALENAGVSGWEGYTEALEEYDYRVEINESLMSTLSDITEAIDSHTNKELLGMSSGYSFEYLDDKFEGTVIKYLHRLLDSQTSLKAFYGIK